MKIDDVIAMRGRVSQATWDHEMLCLPPRYEDAVFPAFRRERHVKAAPAAVRVCANRLALEGRAAEHIVESIICGVDFGYAQAFVCLWLAILRPIIGEMPQRPMPPRPLVWVFDEMVTSAQTVARNAAAMRERSVAGAGSAPAVVYCDVAGRHVNSQTGHSDERIVREAGFVTRSRAMAIDEGIDLIAELLDPAAGEPRLLVDPKCARLIEALEGYRRAASGRAEKDGRHDHLIDALRYALVNHCRESGKVEMRRY